MGKRWVLAGLLIVVLGGAGLGCSAADGGQGAPALAPRAAGPGAFSRLPLTFIANHGQLARDDVAYYVTGRDSALYFGPHGLTIALAERRQAKQRPSTPGMDGDAGQRFPVPPGPRAHWAVAIDFLDPSPAARLVADEVSPATVNIFKGPASDWKTGIPTAMAIRYVGLWAGIDASYAGEGGNLKYTYWLAPGADPTQVRMRIRGATHATIAADGRLEVQTPLGAFGDAAPEVYQEQAGQRHAVAAGYTLSYDPIDDAYVYGFALGEYDPSLALAIDPVVLVYSGFIGGASIDEAFGVAVDGSGNAYVVGYTLSAANSFPVAVGPFLTYGGNQDAFIAKVRADGVGLVYAGYIGGDGFDEAHGVAVDAAGFAYVTGHTESTQSSFPLLLGPDLSYNGGFSDAFVAKVKPDGSGLVYSGYVGGSGFDIAWGIAIDTSGSAYITGQTDSSQATFPALIGPDLSFNGARDAFIAKVRPDGAGLTFAGYLGGSGVDLGQGIAVDGQGNVFITGKTASSEATFPKLVGPDLTSNGGDDAFVAKVRADGTGLVYAGYVGGAGNDAGWGIAVDAAGNAYVTGQTGSDAASFPVRIGPDLTYNGGVWDGFVARVNPAGTGLDWAGYIGGFDSDYGYAIAVDGQGSAYVAGETRSAHTSFPVLLGPGLVHNLNRDAYIAKWSRTVELGWWADPNRLPDCPLVAGTWHGFHTIRPEFSGCGNRQLH